MEKDIDNSIFIGNEEGSTKYEASNVNGGLCYNGIM